MTTYVNMPSELPTKKCFILFHLDGTPMTDKLFSSTDEASNYLQGLLDEGSIKEHVVRSARIFAADCIVTLYNTSNYYLPNLK